MNTSDVGFKLKAPCDDCPFKKTTPLHSGVMSDLPMYDKQLKEGGFAHTCHKTDSRADGYIEQYDGQVQHCYGALTMFNNMEKLAGEKETTPDGYPSTQVILIHALCRGVELDKLNDPNVFGSFKEMAEAYRPMIEELDRKNKEKDEFKVHVSYSTNEGRRRFTI